MCIRDSYYLLFLVHRSYEYLYLNRIQLLYQTIRYHNQQYCIYLHKSLGKYYNHHLGYQNLHLYLQIRSQHQNQYIVQHYIQVIR